MRTLMLISIALLSAAVAGESGMASHPVMKLKPGHWFEVPDSHMIKVAYKWPAGVRYTKNGIGVRGVMSCWNGGAYDTKRDRLIAWGGGHSAYGGNEVYAFDVKKLKWERVSDPSHKIDGGKGDAYPDGTPRSPHTYDFVEYIPSIDKFISMGIYAGYPHGSAGGPSVWQFDFETKKWERKSPRPGGSIPSGSGFDPVSGNEYLHTRNRQLLEWDPGADKWTQLGRGTAHGYKSMGVVDPVGRRYLSIGGGNSIACDVSTLGKLKPQAIAPKGPQDIVKGYAPGLEYDPVLDKVVGWNGGADLFLLDLQKMEWKKAEPAGTNKVVPTPACRAGTYGRFRYIPSLNAYIVVNSVKQNVYIYRLTDRAKQPIPERFIETLKKSKNAKLVKWVAGQVALWPKKTAEPVLKAALKDQRANKEATGLIQAAIKKLGAK